MTSASTDERARRRRAAVPEIRYPPELPISARVDDIAAAVRDHQVVIVAGETGSGKTTQLPKICLGIGRGVRGLIGHTQPRRLAARAVASRIAEELGTTVGDAVGYEVRFSQRTSDATLVKLMTDGILLAGIPSDRSLAAYDTLIIDEAHERSLNIDFLLGYVSQLLPRRPDLKVIITSATIDPERFSRHFGDAPIIEVSGRTYPVEVRYRPLDAAWASDADRTPPDDSADPDSDGDDGALGERDQVQGICDAVAELDAERPGDILVFLSGEREIRDTADALAEMTLPDTEILPLYARLSSAQQQRVFQPHTGRRIVLATNVAETSLTVPGVRYVIDPGTARISRFSTRLKVQRLPIEKVSQASADQRKGRCGRLSEGICIRLYSRDDFDARPRFTEPEILRTSLASVLLQMAALGLGEVRRFPFLDPPDPRQIRDGMQLLHELRAIEHDPESGSRRRASGRRRRAQAGPSLTSVGRTLSRLPVDPRLGRMLVEADANACLDEVLVIVAALSIPDPRLRPVETRQAADAAHARFARHDSEDSTDSDFLAYLNLWRYLQEQQRERSSSQFRKMCRAEYLHYLRVREWQDLHTQLRRVTRDLGMRRTHTPASAAAIHRSLLAGLLSHVGVKDADGAAKGSRKGEYSGARGARFAVWPGSALFSNPPRWIMAAELVETSRLWGRTVARVEPQWAEQIGDHLVKRTHSEPHWDPRRGGVVAYERVTLYGVPLVTSRKVDYGRIDPQLSRELFLRHGLVEGEWQPPYRFWETNQRRLAEAERVEHKLRRRDVVADDEALFAFYDERVGADVTSTRHFDRWWRDVAQRRPDLLDLPMSLLVGDAAGALGTGGFPDVWRLGQLDLALSYLFDPSDPRDGVTVRVPVAVLNQLRPEPFTWHVPGLREELVTELLRSLPKDLRRRLVPVPDTATAVLSRIGPRGLPAPDGPPLLDALERELRRSAGLMIAREDWDLDRIPTHLRITFRVEDERGGVVGEGDDLAGLQRRLVARVRTSLADAAGLERDGVRTWDFATLPQTFVERRDGHTVRGFPALVDTADSVAIRVLGTQAEQRQAMWAGTRRLLLLGAGTPITQAHRLLDNRTKLALSRNPHGSVKALLDDALTCAADELMLRNGGPVWDAHAFAALLDAVKADLVDTLVDVLRTAATILTRAADVDERLQRIGSPAVQPAVDDMRAQLSGLVHAGFLTAKTARRLPDVARYLEAMQRRLDGLVREPARDRRRMERIAEVADAHRRLLARLSPERRTDPAVLEIPWMIEELRVSEFAQSLGTARRVSPERVLRAIDDIPG